MTEPFKNGFWISSKSELPKLSKLIDKRKKLAEVPKPSGTSMADQRSEFIRLCNQSKTTSDMAKLFEELRLARRTGDSDCKLREAKSLIEKSDRFSGHLLTFSLSLHFLKEFLAVKRLAFDGDIAMLRFRTWLEIQPRI